MDCSYDRYNREERALCSHLFRLLHEPAPSAELEPPIVQFARLLIDNREIEWIGDPNLSPKADWQQVRMYSEVALLRDAYKDRLTRAEHDEFMDEIVAEVSRIENVNDCISWSELMAQQTKGRIHPRRVLNTLENRGLSSLIDGNQAVYCTIQSMFNSKPDMALTFNGHLVLIEAKFTQKRDGKQIALARKIVRVWASILYEDLGFAELPKAYAVATLGAHKDDITWSDVANIADQYYNENDISRRAFRYAVDL